jgi:hypothetical protein
MSAVNRRAILAGAATLPAMSIPAFAEPDPIFAAIEAHRRADAAYCAACEADVPEIAMDAAWAAADKLLNIRPTTVAGVAALLRYLYEFEKENPETFCGSETDDDWPFLLCRRAAEALEAIEKAPGKFSVT